MLAVGRSNQQLSETWRAVEMPLEHFNPYDVSLPGVPTIKFEGTEKLGKVPVEWSFETQEHLVDNPDVIFPFFSGFGGIKMSSGPFGNAMAQLEMGTLTLETIRRDDRSCRERLFNPHKIHIEAMEAAIEGLEAETGIKISDNPGGTKVAPIGHSMGGESALRFAEANNKKAIAVILFATIGFGSPNVLSIISKIPAGIKPAVTEEILPFINLPEVPKDLKTTAKALGYFAINPARTIGEAGSCLTSRQSERSRRLHLAGIPVIYGQPVYDLLVQGIDGARCAVSTVSEIPRAGHMVVQAKPGRAAYWVRSVLQTTAFAEAA
jgi:pimeloyl-ACP methyl ester carboxylesterase